MERHITKKEDIIVLRIDNKDWSMNRIAKEVGCSREYVRLILKREGLPTAVGHWASGKMKYHRNGLNTIANRNARKEARKEGKARKTLSIGRIKLSIV
jgi:AraC-like DNA-binding protein